MLSPLQAIHHHCALCVAPGDRRTNNAEIARCAYTACPLFFYRLGKMPSLGEVEKVSPLKACRAFCLEECQGGGRHKAMEVKTCRGDAWTIAPCPLYPFRFGRSPNRKRKKHVSQA